MMPTVAFISPPEPRAKMQGDFFYRNYAPALALSQTGKYNTISLDNISTAKELILSEADLVILVNVVDPDLFPLITKRKVAGRPTIYEVNDDYKNLQPWNPVYSFYSQEENVKTLEDLAGYCDGVLFSSRALMDKYSTLNSRRFLFENHLLSPPSLRARNNALITIGWGGSFGHYKDMENLSKVLVSWLARTEGVKLHIMASEKICNLFSTLPKNKFSQFTPGSIQDYYRFLTTLDIGIIHLEETSFNICRSDIKFVEYAGHGVVPLVKKSTPYLKSMSHGNTGFFYRDLNGLIQLLSRLIKSPQLLAKVKQRAYQYVMDKRLYEKRINELVNALNTLPYPGTSPSPKFGDWKKRHLKSSNFVYLRHGHFEKLLIAILTEISQQQPDIPLINELCARAQILQPDSYLPPLYSARFAEDPEESYDLALTRNPFSLKALIEKAKFYLEQGKIVQAFQILDSVERNFPFWSFPKTLAYQIAKRLQRQESGVQVINV